MRKPSSLRAASLLVGVLIAGVPDAFARDSSAAMKLAVLDLGDKGVGADVAAMLTVIVANELHEIGIFEVISRDDIKKLLTHKQNEILLGCTGESCLIDIGDMLGVQDLVAGEVGKVGDKFVIGLQRIDVKNARVVKRVERQVEGGKEKLIAEVATATYKVVEDILVAQSGSVLFSVSEEAADISIDGKTVGTSPLAQLPVPAGPRDIQVHKKGFVRWSRTIQVEPKGIQMVEVSLIPSAAFIEEYESQAHSMRTWAWITLGAFIAMEAGALGLRTYTYVNYDPIEDDYNAGRFGGLSQQEYYDKYSDDMQRAEVMDYTALGLGVVGLVAGAMCMYFFLEGEIERYERFRGFKSVVAPVEGGASLNMLWEF